jgi:elongation factor P--(R)-beta-lysine ligase
MSDDFRPTACWENLRFRAALLRRLREFFDSHGFLEVETPILSADTVVDRHIDPFFLEGSGIGGHGAVERGEGREGRGEGRIASGQTPNPQIPKSPYPQIPKSLNPSPPAPRLWLQTSPEFAMKRMLAAGAGPIYHVARVFRQGELGPLHNPEFTLVEWYQPGDGYFDGMQLTGELCVALLNQRYSRSEKTAFLTAERISYREAFQRHVGIDPHAADGASLRAITRKLGIEAPDSLSAEDCDGWLDLLLVERIQPHLGIERPTILYDYPASQAALARIRQDENHPPVAERFELYIGGVEIANGYHELLDPAELRARNAAVNRQRLSDGKSALPEESRLLAAMEAGLPSSVGVALGFDRLAMAALGAKSIAEVMAFPFDRA